MAITHDDVLHLAALCRMDLAPDEVDRFAEQLSAVLAYVDQLRAVEISEADAVAHVTGLENIAREDVLRACPPDVRERILAQFPMREGDFLKTRGVFDGP